MKIKEIQNALAESNKILDYYYDKIVINRGKLGVVLGNEKINKPKFVAKLLKFRKNSNQDFEFNRVTIPCSDIDKILISKSLEEFVILKYNNMANSFSFKYKSSVYSQEDLYSESILVIINCIYNYTKTDVTLTTYIYNSIKNKIQNIIRKTNPLSNYSMGCVKLYENYERFVNQQKNLNKPCDFDTIVNLMELSSKEIKTLTSMIVCNTAEFSSELEVSCKVNKVEYEEEDFNLVRDCEFSDLSELEKAVLEGYLNNTSKSLGINSVAKNLINPRTKKPYSRMAITYAWRRIKDKIKKYSKVA